MRDLLIIKPSSLGDIVHGLLIAESIRAQWPEVRIDWIVRDRFAPLVELSPAIDRALHFRRGHGPWAFATLLREVRRRRYDAVLDLQGLLRTGIMTVAARAPTKIGRRDAREGATWFYDTTAPLPPGEGPNHAVDILRQFLPLIGLKPDVSAPVTFDRLPPLAGIDRRLGRGEYILMCPHSRDRVKEWGGFEAAAATLLDDPKGPAIVWDSHEPIPDPPFGAHARFVNTSGRTGIPDLIALVENARLVVANDSGPMHLAAGIGVPLLALFGPSDPDRFGPFPPDHPTNRVLSAPGGDLSRLPAASVVTAIREALSP